MNAYWTPIVDRNCLRCWGYTQRPRQMSLPQRGPHTLLQVLPNYGPQVKSSPLPVSVWPTSPEWFWRFLMVRWGGKKKIKRRKIVHHMWKACEIHISVSVNKILSKQRHSRWFLYFCITTAEQRGQDGDSPAYKAEDSYFLTVYRKSFCPSGWDGQ